MTIGTKTPGDPVGEALHGALPDCASSTSRAIWASWVSAPTRVARTTSRPPAFTVAPTTASPGPTSTGTDSPVTIDASTAALPSTTTPSVAIFSPGARRTGRRPAGRRSGCATSMPSRQHRDILRPELQQRSAAPRRRA